jgi:hypothetical protein
MYLNEKTACLSLLKDIFIFYPLIFLTMPCTTEQWLVYHWWVRVPQFERLALYRHVISRAWGHCKVLA